MKKNLLLFLLIGILLIFLTNCFYPARSARERAYDNYTEYDDRDYEDGNYADSRRVKDYDEYDDEGDYDADDTAYNDDADDTAEPVVTKKVYIAPPVVSVYDPIYYPYSAYSNTFYLSGLGYDVYYINGYYYAFWRGLWWRSYYHNRGWWRLRHKRFVPTWIWRIRNRRIRHLRRGYTYGRVMRRLKPRRVDRNLLRIRKRLGAKRLRNYRKVRKVRRVRRVYRKNRNKRYNRRVRVRKNSNKRYNRRARVRRRINKDRRNTNRRKRSVRKRVYKTKTRRVIRKRTYRKSTPKKEYKRSETRSHRKSR